MGFSRQEYWSGLLFSFSNSYHSNPNPNKPSHCGFDLHFPKTVETVSDFIFLGSKITADGDCSHEIKRHLLLGRKVMTNLDSTLKSRYITLPTKVRLVKAVVFPVVIYGCESWTVKKAERWIIGVEERWTVVLEKTLDLQTLGLQGDPTSPFWRRSALGFLWKEWC